MQVGFLRTWIKRKTDIRKLKMTTFIYIFKSVALSNLFICFFFNRSILGYPIWYGSTLPRLMSV
jgi:hypothetical protein